MQPVWRLLIPDFDVPAKPEGLWTQVLDYVGPSRKLRIMASGTWVWQEPTARASTPAKSADEKRECGPDGDPEMPPSTDALSQDALIGALIGKIGGSSAAIKNTNSFAVGRHCVVEVTDTTKGPLYLTINDVPGGMANNSGALKVSVWEAL